MGKRHWLQALLESIVYIILGLAFGFSLVYIILSLALGSGKPDSCENRLIAICFPDALVRTGTCPGNMRSGTVLKRSKRDIYSHLIQSIFFLNHKKRFERPRESTIWHCEVLLVYWS